MWSSENKVETLNAAPNQSCLSPTPRTVLAMPVSVFLRLRLFHPHPAHPPLLLPCRTRLGRALHGRRLNQRSGPPRPRCQGPPPPPRRVRHASSRRAASTLPRPCPAQPVQIAGQYTGSTLMDRGVAHVVDPGWRPELTVSLARRLRSCRLRFRRLGSASLLPIFGQRGIE